MAQNTNRGLQRHLFIPIILDVSCPYTHGDSLVSSGVPADSRHTWPQRHLLCTDRNLCRYTGREQNPSGCSYTLKEDSVVEETEMWSFRNSHSPFYCGVFPLWGELQYMYPKMYRFLPRQCLRSCYSTVQVRFRHVPCSFRDPEQHIT